jgi:hypothetical protein
MKKYKITVIAQRIGDLLDMQERNRQDHMVQLLQMDFESVIIHIKELEDESTELTDS